MKNRKNCKKILLSLLLASFAATAIFFYIKRTEKNEESSEKLRNKKIKLLLSEADSLLRKNKR